MQYLKPSQIYIGSSVDTGVAQFFRIAHSKEKKLLSAAQTYDLSVGEYLFELMSGESIALKTLQNFLEGE